MVALKYIFVVVVGGGGDGIDGITDQQVDGSERKKFGTELRYSTAVGIKMR